jgi:hypothetical protein
VAGIGDGTFNFLPHKSQRIWTLPVAGINGIFNFLPIAYCSNHSLPLVPAPALRLRVVEGLRVRRVSAYTHGITMK